MSNIITFGSYKGKSFEWLFFKAPWYVEYIRSRGIHNQRHAFSEEECDYFLELCHRASHLTGNCRWCKERRLTRMGLSTQYGSEALGAVGFYCDECEYQGGSPTDYYEPSFFLPYDAPKCEQLRLTTYIKNRYIGPHERLTQKKMERFFHDDANFSRMTKGYFTDILKNEAMQ